MSELCTACKVQDISRYIYSIISTHLTGGMEFLKMLPNLQLAMGWSDLPVAAAAAEQQAGSGWGGEQLAARHRSGYPGPGPHLAALPSQAQVVVRRRILTTISNNSLFCNYDKDWI